MSRIGRKPIVLPKEVKFNLTGEEIFIEGPRGKLHTLLPNGITLERQEGQILFKRDSEEGRARSLHGLVRGLVQNMVDGVMKGYEKTLDIVGVGYRAEVQGKEIVLSLGFSQQVRYRIPEGIQMKVDKQTHIVIQGADKHQVGQVAAEIRSLRPPEPYKGKGIQYTGERLKRKVGKAAGTKSAA